MTRARRTTAAARDALARAIFASAPYRWSLADKTPKALIVAPAQPWPGDAARGAQILKGSFAVGAELRPLGENAWSAEGSEHWRAALHGFAWLGDLHAVGSDAARRRARELIADWLARHRRWDEFTWRTDILTRRVTAWIAEHDFFCASADDGFRAAFFRALSRQCRHLFRVAPGREAGVRRLLVARAMIYAAVALPGPKQRLLGALRLLETELRRQILPDGGHVERSGRAQLAALRTLVDIRTCLASGSRPLPIFLQATIDRMVPALRAFRHADGGFALFNGACEDDAWLIDAVLAQAEVPGRAPDELRHTGIQRLRAGRTLVIVDAGAPPQPGYDRAAHAGTLSFEMGVGKDRLIVNCGARDDGTQWQDAMRGTSAHSALTISGASSSAIGADGGLHGRPGAVECARHAADGAVWIEAAHDGYRRSFGAIHRRRLYLSADGHDLRGEDRVEAAGAVSAVARFHLHPSVSASLQAGGESVLLRGPGGDGWRFRATGGTLSLAESIYMGRRDEARRCEQIEVRAEFAPGGGALKWALRRVGPDD